MTEHRDEFESLRSAWRELRAPDDLATAEPDLETRACMDWMASAWESLDPPRIERPQPRAGTPRTLRRHLLRITLPFAAAASVLIMLQARLAGPTVESRSPLESARAEPLRSVVLANGSVETRSGRVRLILLPDPPNETPSPRTSPTKPTPVELPMENSR